MDKQKILIESGIDVNEGIELLGDIELYEEILEEFYKQYEERLISLEKYKVVNDMTNYAILVHAIKSDSKYLGFNKLAEIALEHELKSKIKDIDYINDNYEKLLEEFKRIILVLQTYFKK